jgi:leucyl-tRNA synthetase
MSTISVCPDILDNCDRAFPSTMAIPMLQQPTAGAIERMAELWSCRSKVKRLEEQSEEATHELALADKRAIKGIRDVFRAEDRVKKAKAELFNAQNLLLRAELESTRLLNETAKAC